MLRVLWLPDHKTPRSRRMLLQNSSLRRLILRTWCSKRMRQSYLLPTLQLRQLLRHPGRPTGSAPWWRPRLSVMVPISSRCLSKTTLLSMAQTSNSISLLGKARRIRMTFTRLRLIEARCRKNWSRDHSRSKMRWWSLQLQIDTWLKSATKYSSKLSSRMKIMKRRPSTERLIDETKQKLRIKMEASSRQLRKRERQRLTKKSLLLPASLRTFIVRSIKRR